MVNHTEKEFNPTACRQCVAKPCQNLIYGIGTRPVPMLSDKLGKPDCIFVCQDKAEMRFLLSTMSTEEIRQSLMQALGSQPLSYLMPVGLAGNQIKICEDLVKSGVLKIVRIPFNIAKVKKFKEWFEENNRFIGGSGRPVGEKEVLGEVGASMLKAKEPLASIPKKSSNKTTVEQEKTIGKGYGGGISKTHTVQTGDTLAAIGQKYGVSSQELAKDNNIANPNVIYPGQVIRIPDGNVMSSEKLPVKSKQEVFIESIAKDAQDTQKDTGVPASITIAQAILETGWGKHRIGDANNFFGVKGKGLAGSVIVSTLEEVNGEYVTIKGEFRKYNTINESFIDNAKVITEKISGAMQYKDDPKKFVEYLEGKYATDSQYAEKLINIMDKYNLYQYNK